MKIAFIVGSFPVLSYTPILNQATGLIDKGHDVDIFSFSRGDTKEIHSDVQKYELLEKVVYLDPLSPVSDRVRASLALDGKLSRNMGVMLPLVNLFRFVRDTLSLLILFRSSFFDRKGPYDVIHCQMGSVGNRFLPFHRLRMLGGKVIVQFRGEDLTEFVKQKGKGVYRKLFQEADYFMPVCEYLRKRAVALGCPEDKIFVMKSAVDLKRFKFLERRKPIKGPTRIAFVGRLVEKKGVEYVIRALSVLKKRGYPVELLIVGDGLLKKNLESLCRELNIEKSIIFLGAKNHDQIVEILNSVYLFVAPSVTSRTGNQEGIPNVLKEAMAVGLPVVSTYHGGIPELVEDGVSGFLVPERDSQALADRLGYLIEHPERWPEMGRAGRLFVERNYDKETLNRQLMDIYRHVVG